MEHDAVAEFPAMPLWTDAYLSDTTHLSYTESGIYLAILMHMWRSPECRIPHDRDWLMRKFRLCEAEFDNTLIPLLKEFCQCDGNWWIQKRLVKEWKYVKLHSVKQRDRAKSRWNKQKQASRGNATRGIDPAMPPHPHHYTNVRDSDVTEESLFPDSESPPRPVYSRARARVAPNGADINTPEKRAKRRQLSSIPDDWEPDIEFARSKGLSDPEINRQANRMLDWAKASEKRYCDWQAVWRNWVRSYLERQNGTGVH